MSLISLPFLCLLIDSVRATMTGQSTERSLRSYLGVAGDLLFFFFLRKKCNNTKQLLSFDSAKKLIIQFNYVCDILDSSTAYSFFSFVFLPCASWVYFLVFFGSQVLYWCLIILSILFFCWFWSVLGSQSMLSDVPNTKTMLSSQI